MRYAITCKVCGDTVCIGGSYDPSVNALELNDNDRHWDEACEHVKAGGDYEIGEGEAEEWDG
jgi:hypothetical protein